MEKGIKIGHAAIPVEAGKQKSIWELPYTQHCSIVGTCLSLGEARLIGKKINASCPNPEDLDSTIHSILVQECATKNWASRLITDAKQKI